MNAKKLPTVCFVNESNLITRVFTDHFSDRPDDETLVCFQSESLAAKIFQSPITQETLAKMAPGKWEVKRFPFLEWVIMASAAYEQGVHYAVFLREEDKGGVRIDRCDLSPLLGAKTANQFEKIIRREVSDGQHRSPNLN
jgi:hypothetical protein